MDRRQARLTLGLRVDCSDGDVLQAYAALSRILKRRIVAAATLAERRKQQRALRNLVQLRDLALERPVPRAAARAAAPVVQDGWTPADGVPRNVEYPTQALAFFGVCLPADRSELDAVFFARSRALKAEIAKASSEGDLRVAQESLARLNQVYHLANELGDGGKRISLPDAGRLREGDDDETLTDVLPSYAGDPDTDPNAVTSGAETRRRKRDRKHEDLADSLSDFDIPPDAFML